MIGGHCIRCFVGNTTVPSQRDDVSSRQDDIVDCSTLGIQREELYCRNISVYDSGVGEKMLVSVTRTCVAMSWYASGWEPIGCKNIPSKSGSGGTIRCTCTTDLCNAPRNMATRGKMKAISSAISHFSSLYTITTLFSLDLCIFATVHCVAFPPAALVSRRFQTLAPLLL